MVITAAVLAEICSALPLSGSIYIWAAESAGPKYARFFGFIVAWWACTAWMTFTASNCQVIHSLYRNFALALLTTQTRLRQTTSFPNFLFMRLISLEALTTAMSSGGLSFGPFPKLCSFSQPLSTYCLRNIIPWFSNSLSVSSCSTLSSV